MGEQLREKIEAIIANSVDKVPLDSPMYQNIILRVGEAADQILSAIEEGIEVCARCGGDPEAPICETCGGKGWVMK